MTHLYKPTYWPESLPQCRCGCGQLTVLDRRGRSHAFLRGHRKGRHGAFWKGGRFVDLDGYIFVYRPNHSRTQYGLYVREHLLIAERALGRAIAPPAQVHHVDFNRSNNKPSNLVICENQRYHYVLHRRTLAFRICGHADWLRCLYCKQYCPPEFVSQSGRRVYHRLCAASYAKRKAS